jgi:hypothetical protein
MQGEVPPDFAERMKEAGLALSYDDSGWCFVEAAITGGLKVGIRRLDLRLRPAEAMGLAYGGVAWDPEDTLEGTCAALRPPPLLPDKVRHLLETEKKFTAAADIEVVDQLYRTFFDGITESATCLDFSGLQWGPSQMRQLLAVLVRFASLRELKCVPLPVTCLIWHHMCGLPKSYPSTLLQPQQQQHQGGGWEAHGRVSRRQHDHDQH